MKTKQEETYTKEYVDNLVKEKAKFLNNLSHDLGTPLTPILTLLPIALSKLEEGPLKDDIEISIKNANYINNIVQSALTLARLQMDETKANLKKVDLKKIIDDIVLSNKRTCSINRINLSINTKNIYAMADEAMIKDVLEKLFSNSIKNTPVEGVLSVFTKEDNDFVIISVNDTGIGIMPENVDKIFLESFKEDESRHDLSGTGLSLAICRVIIEKHGGKIWAESEGINMGTTVNFALKKA